MKRRLNILCVLVMLVLGYSVFNSAYRIGNAFMDGFNAGIDHADEPKRLNETISMRSIAIIPDNYANMTDSVFNEKTGEYAPAIYSKMAVSVKIPFNPWLKFLAVLCTFVDMFTMVLAIYLFVKLIITINKSNIFCWKNVRRLRWLGIVLVLNFMSSFLPVCINAYEMWGAFSVPGYSLTPSELVSSLTLVLGIVSLIVGEVFAIGLRMQEEQELTI